MASLLSGNVSNQLVGVFLDSLLSRPYLAGFRVLGSRGGVGNLIVVVITTFVILFQLKRSPSSLHVHLPHSRFGNPLIISPKHDLNLVSNQIYIEERINAHKSHLYWADFSLLDSNEAWSENMNTDESTKGQKITSFNFCDLSIYNFPWIIINYNISQ